MNYLHSVVDDKKYYRNPKAHGENERRLPETKKSILSFYILCKCKSQK